MARIPLVRWTETAPRHFKASVGADVYVLHRITEREDGSWIVSLSVKHPEALLPLVLMESSPEGWARSWVERAALRDREGR